MGKRENDYDEALKSPFSRVYLCPQTEQIINCAMGLRYPIDLEALKNAFSNSIMIKHPRFCSLMVRDSSGEQHWKKTHVDVDDHIIIHHHQTAVKSRHLDDDDDDNEAAINAYLADVAVSTPLSKNKPLWELHVLMGFNCVVLRVHHALGDGVSLMSMLWACFGTKRDDFEDINSGIIGDDHSLKNTHKERKRCLRQKGVLGLVKCLWFTLVFGLRIIWRIFGVKDKTSVISGGDGVELWPRKLVTLKFKLEDFRSIKEAIPNATINDVLLGVLSSGLSKYLDVKSPKAILQGLQVTGIVVVNLRRSPGFQEMSDLMRTKAGSSSSWGNKTGLVLQPVYCCKGLQPLDHVRAMKSIMDKKKHSYEAHLPHIALQLLASYLGPKVASWVCHRVLCNTTLLVSNIMGPPEEMAIAGNPITYLRVNISSQPQALTVHMVSYAGRADLQVMVVKDIINDPQFLATCFQESLLEMKIAAKQAN